MQEQPTTADLDRPVIDSWWRTFVATGSVPSDLAYVQGRLIRSVHRGLLPSGPVHIKTMTFPRKKDRLRYAFRALPAEHEAKMLAATRAAGIPCPEVLFVRVQRRLLLPHRSMLVLRSLPVAETIGNPHLRLEDEVDLAHRLLCAGIHHRDLHCENFVRCESGGLAVLDMQSASRSRSHRVPPATVRISVAARLLRDRCGEDRHRALLRMRSVGLLQSDVESTAAIRQADTQARRYHESRVKRCLTTSSEFVRHTRASGVEFRLRGELPQGRWWPGDSSLRQAWVGQRIRQLQGDVPPVFAAFFQKWWWLGGGAALYVPDTCEEERIAAEICSAVASAGQSVGALAGSESESDS